MRSLTHHTCATCHKHHEGKLFQFENKWYCKEHFRANLDWHETRSNLVAALQTGHVLGVKVIPEREKPDYTSLTLEGRRHAEHAAFHLKYTDRPGPFVRSFLQAMWAWERMK